MVSVVSVVSVVRFCLISVLPKRANSPLVFEKVQHMEHF